jgi:hypothetical protein
MATTSPDRILDLDEPVFAETLVSQPAAEAFDEGIL